jgi:hypothetical protein
MKQWLKRAGYLLVILLWLVLVSFPVVAFLLATQGQLQIGDESSGLRLFLLQDADSQGLGLQWTRPYENPENPDPTTCTRTLLRYWLWEGGGTDQNLDYCQCFNPQTQQPLPVDACSLP